MVQKYQKLGTKQFFTSSGYDKFTNNILDEKLVNKSDISRFINNTDLNEKIKTLATTAELNSKTLNK